MIFRPESAPERQLYVLESAHRFTLGLLQCRTRPILKIPGAALEITLALQAWLLKFSGCDNPSHAVRLPPRN